MQQKQMQSGPLNKRFKKEDAVSAIVAANASISSEMSMSSQDFVQPEYTPDQRRNDQKHRKAHVMRCLRKWLIPKTAMSALNELLGPGMTECAFTTNGNQTKAEVVINNVKYQALGSGMKQAKALACEMALRDLAMPQINRVKQQQEGTQANKTVPPTASSAPMWESASNASEEMHVDDDGKTDALLMVQLAGFALHKLFEEWSPKVPKPLANLPADFAAFRHPMSLLVHMRPQLAYQELGSTDNPVNPEFVVRIVVDGMKFTGVGRTKKLARKAAAMSACKTLFGVEFDGSVLNTSVGHQR